MLTKQPAKLNIEGKNAFVMCITALKRCQLKIKVGIWAMGKSILDGYASLQTGTFQWETDAVLPELELFLAHAGRGFGDGKKSNMISLITNQD
ncbi:hypothetical protein [Cellvibrio mixtus]|uniref:hypothetical protein n=1 Tax=Cellvibrio mixtus TaxID=39650 RepID=UPI000586F1F6|nr:hypothetical protein [Cellvibrio mixtus]